MVDVVVTIIRAKLQSHHHHQQTSTQDGGACVEVSTWCSPSLSGWPVCAGPLRAWSPATESHGVWDSAGPACPDCYRSAQLRHQWTMNMEQSASRS